MNPNNDRGARAERQTEETWTTDQVRRAMAKVAWTFDDMADDLIEELRRG